MTVGIVGMGLIGGSLARAYRGAGHTVFGYDRDASVHEFAILSGALDGVLKAERLAACEIILISVYPSAAVAYIEEHAKDFPVSSLVMDCCGVKREVCAAGFSAAERYGFTFVGGHPMAGGHHSGFKYSDPELFWGAPMVIVPPVFDDIRLLDRVKGLLAPVGFGSLSVTSAEEHDRMIAFTSQLAHILSSAYIKSPTAASHRGFSAGSYRDMTRVAWLNPDMWTELFACNRENVLFELDSLIANLTEYREAVADADDMRMRRLLEEGRRRKEEVDGT